MIPQRGSEKEVIRASQWELLNLDVDTILKRPCEVEAITKLQHQEFIKIMENYLYEFIGALEFMRRHKLTKTPCVVVPDTSHNSFAKAVALLGLGRDSLVTVAVDQDARMDAKDEFYIVLSFFISPCKNLHFQPRQKNIEFKFVYRVLLIDM